MQGGRYPKCPGGQRLKEIDAQGSERVTRALAKWMAQKPDLSDPEE